MLGYATPKDIADAVNIHPNTVRNWADAGLIQCRRDFRGRRLFPKPLETVKRIKALIDGTIKLDGDVQLDERLKQS